MAKFEDYAKKFEDELESEIQEAAERKEDRENREPENSFEVPERFRNKSPEEIAKAYVELEKAYSRQGNDLGKMRQTFDEFIKLQSQASPQENASPQAEERKPVTIDDLYDNADDAVRRVVKEESGTRIEQLEQQLQEERVRLRLNDLNQKFPDWEDKVKSPEFGNWLAEKQYRQRLAVAADQYDLDAAEELLEMYYDTQVVREDKQEERQRQQTLQKAELESAGGEEVEFDQTFSRVDLLNKRIAAKQGDAEAARWLAANAEAIAIAYEEGRITD